MIGRRIDLDGRHIGAALLGDVVVVLGRRYAVGCNCDFCVVSTTSVRSTSLSFQAFCGRKFWLPASCSITSWTSPVVTAETIFCIKGPKGMMLWSILFPLAFSYSATMLRKEASSSGTNPCCHHTVAVLAAALAMKGRAKAPAAANPNDARSTERLLSLFMAVLPCPSLVPRHLFATRVLLSTRGKHLGTPAISAGGFSGQFRRGRFGGRHIRHDFPARVPAGFAGVGYPTSRALPRQRHPPWAQPPIAGLLPSRSIASDV